MESVRTVVQFAPEQMTRLAGRHRILFGERTIDVAFTVVGDRLAFVGQSGKRRRSMRRRRTAFSRALRGPRSASTRSAVVTHDVTTRHDQHGSRERGDLNESWRNGEFPQVGSRCRLSLVGTDWSKSPRRFCRL